jgi:hypothetical protein
VREEGREGEIERRRGRGERRGEREGRIERERGGRREGSEAYLEFLEQSWPPYLVSVLQYY